MRIVEAGGRHAPLPGLRVGLALFLPTLRWRHELGDFFYELDAIGVVGRSYQARGGIRF